MNNNLQPIPKLELTRKQNQELKIYFMIGKRPLPNVPNAIEEKVVAILAYTLEDAFTKAKHDHQGIGLFYNGQNTTVRQFLARIQSQGTVISLPTHPSEQKVEEPLPIKKINFEQFRNSLMLAADDFLEGRDKEREVLKKIIEKLDQS